MDEKIKELENLLNISSLKAFLEDIYINKKMLNEEISLILYKTKDKSWAVRNLLKYFEIPSRSHGESAKISNIKKIESKLNIDNLKDFLIQKYIIEQLPDSQIAEIIYNKKKNAPNVRKLRLYFEIESRDRSTSVKLQYKGIKGELRKQQASKIAQKYFNSPENRNKVKKIMQTREYKEKQRISKTGKLNGMFGVTGSKHPLWNPNKTRLQRQKDRKTLENQRFVNECLKRDEFTCKCCGNRGKLVVHHLNGYHWDIKHRFDIENGVTLCEECHKKYHHIYGSKYSKKEDFEKFLKQF